MRKIFNAIVLMTALLMLASCSEQRGRKAEEYAARLRTSVLAAVNFELTASVRADYGERVFEFKYTFSGIPDEALITISEPEEIAGVTVKVSNGGATLNWDGAVVDTGELPGGITPIGALPLLIKEWQNGYMTKYSYETVNKRHLLVIETEINETLRQTTVFNADTYMPERSEISENGRVVLTAEFSKADYS